MGSERRSVRLGLIPLVELEQVGIDLRVEALELPFELALGDIASAVVGGLGFSPWMATSSPPKRWRSRKSRTEVRDRGEHGSGGLVSAAGHRSLRSTTLVQGHNCLSLVGSHLADGRMPQGGGIPARPAHQDSGATSLKWPFWPPYACFPSRPLHALRRSAKGGAFGGAPRAHDHAVAATPTNDRGRQGAIPNGSPGLCTSCECT